jgi:hypothetical protein
LYHLPTLSYPSPEMFTRMRHIHSNNVNLTLSTGIIFASAINGDMYQHVIMRCFA